MAIKKKTKKLPKANFGMMMGQAGQQVGQMLNSVISAGIPALNAIIPDQTDVKMIRPYEAPAYNPNAYGTGNSPLLFDNGGGMVNQRTKSGMQVSYFDPGQPDMKSLPTIPMKPLGNKPKKQENITYEKLRDAQGNEFYSPVFPQGWSDKQVKDSFASLPDNFGNGQYRAVNNYGEWREYWNGMGAKRTKSNSNPVQPISYNPYGGDMVQFQGPSHEQGGIDISFGGNKAEVEGDETGFVDRLGDLNILGNMKVPGSNKKFKQIGKDIAAAEQKTTKLSEKANMLMSSSDPTTQETGRIMFNSADRQLQEHAKNKEQLAQVQNLLLGMADSLGMKPQKFAKEFAKGGIIPKYPDGGNMASDFNRAITFGMPVMNQESLYQPPVADNTSVVGNNYVQPLANDKQAVPKDAKERAKYATKFFIEQGLAPHIATGIVGNLYQESKLNPGVKDGDKRGGFGGIAQWDPKRSKTMINWAQSHSLDPYELDTQLNFVLYEAKQRGDLKKINKAKTPQEAAMLFGKLYERPNEKYAAWDVRQSIADNLFQGYSAGEFKQGGKMKYDDGGGLYNPYDFSRGTINNLGSATQPVNLDEVTISPSIQPLQPLGIQPLPDTTPKPPTPLYRDFNGNETTTPPTSMNVTGNKKKSSLADSNKLGIGDFIGNLAALAYKAPHLDYRPLTPTFESPYTISMQDQVNDVNSAYRTASKGVGNNAAAQSILFGEAAKQLTGIRGNEFRTNQGIANDISNRNVQHLRQINAGNNQMGMQVAENNAMADDMTSKVRLNNIMNVQDTVQKHKAVNNQIRMYESMSDYRLNPETGKMEYVGDRNYVNTPTVGSNYSANTNGAKSFNDMTKEQKEQAFKLMQIANGKAEYGKKLIGRKIEQIFRYGGQVKK